MDVKNLFLANSFLDTKRQSYLEDIRNDEGPYDDGVKESNFFDTTKQEIQAVQKKLLHENLPSLINNATNDAINNSIEESNRSSDQREKLTTSDIRNMEALFYPEADKSTVQSVIDAAFRDKYIKNASDILDKAKNNIVNFFHTQGIKLNDKDRNNIIFNDSTNLSELEVIATNNFEDDISYKLQLDKYNPGEFNLSKYANNRFDNYQDKVYYEDTTDVKSPLVKEFKKIIIPMIQENKPELISKIPAKLLPGELLSYSQ